MWAVPALALAGVAVFLYVQVTAERGPRVRVTFRDAAGIKPEAEVIYKGLRVGVVRDVRLSESLDTVTVIAELAPHAAGLAAEGSRFWIVQPEVSLDRVSGLDTLLGPRYIAVRPAAAGARPAGRFVGLEGPPQPEIGLGFPIRLRGATAGAIAVGSPVLYRGVEVGVVTGVALADDASHIEIDAAIGPRYAPLVRDNTRFWDAGGVGVNFGLFRGLSVRAGSLDAVLRGAIGMATPTRPGQPVEPGAAFDLAATADPSWAAWRPQIPLGDDPDGP
jgi:paraquat-inducible protein B